jgi:hypothetical protein
MVIGRTHVDGVAATQGWFSSLFLIYIYILYIYYAPGCILYSECTQAQLAEPTRLP